MMFHNIRNSSAKATAILVLPIGVAAFAAPAAQAQMVKPTVDSNHSLVLFSVSHGGFAQVIGRFRTIKQVDFKFDPKNVENSKIKFVVDAASLDTNHAYRDNWARSAHELNVWKFPTVTFQSTKVVKTGTNSGKVTGNLTMHGVTKQITVDVIRIKSGKHFNGKTWIDAFKAVGKIKRSDFGMKMFTMIGKTPWIGDEITFTVYLEQNQPVSNMKK